MSYQKPQVGEGMKYPFILILDYHTGANIARRQLSFETLSSMVDAANNFGRQPSTRRVITTVILSDQHYMNGNQQGRQL